MPWLIMLHWSGILCAILCNYLLAEQAGPQPSGIWEWHPHVYHAPPPGVPDPPLMFWCCCFLLCLTPVWVALQRQLATSPSTLPREKVLPLEEVPAHQSWQAKFSLAPFFIGHRELLTPSHSLLATHTGCLCFLCANLLARVAPSASHPLCVLTSCSRPALRQLHQCTPWCWRQTCTPPGDSQMATNLASQTGTRGGAGEKWEVSTRDGHETKEAAVVVVEGSSRKGLSNTGKLSDTKWPWPPPTHPHTHICLMSPVFSFTIRRIWVLNLKNCLGCKRLLASFWNLGCISSIAGPGQGVSSLLLS